MTSYTKTGNVLLAAFSEMLNDLFTSDTTASGNATGTTLEDDRFKHFPKDTLKGRWIRITESGDTSINEVRQITSNDLATVTVDYAFSGTIGSSKAYEMHKWEPRLKFAALDTARLDGFPAVALQVFDETFTPDGDSNVVTVPPTILRGPIEVRQELSLSADQNWNFLANPDGTTLATWALSGAGAGESIYTRVTGDKLIPKYDETCTRLTVAVTTATTYTQVIGDMINGLTAANAGGRYLTAAMWVYARVASRVTLLLIDDDGTVTTSSAHQGRGWERLEAAGTIDGDNATTLSVQLAISSGAVMTVFWNRAYLRFGALPNIYHRDLGRFTTHRDGNLQRVVLDEVPTSRLNLQLSGWDYLSELGDTAATQATNTMEVDAGTAQLLYAFAAKALFRALGLSAEAAGPAVQAQIADAEAYKEELQREHRVKRAGQRRLVSPWG